MNKFIELTVFTSHEGAELVADILGEYTELGVSIKDYQDAIDLSKNGKYWDYVDEGVILEDTTVLVKSGYPIDEAEDVIVKIKERLKLLKEFSPFDLGSLEVVTAEIDGDLWRKQWQENFKPIHINNVVVVPDWIKYCEKQNEIKVLLGSNMAFGTGEHETTSMCLEYLQKYVKPESVVIDVGCGSGILGITACKLGASEVLMTDIDECAIDATNQNMALNEVANGKALLKNLLDDSSIVGDVIVCNIMAEVLIAFAPNLKNNVKLGGIVILSGILNDRLDKVENAYIAQGFEVIERKSKGEWSATALKKVK